MGRLHLFINSLASYLVPSARNTVSTWKEAQRETLKEPAQEEAEKSPRDISTPGLPRRDMWMEPWKTGGSYSGRKKRKRGHSLQRYHMAVLENVAQLGKHN